MNIFEPHIHMYSRTTDDYQRMYQAGIRVCLEPSFWLGTTRRYAGTFLDYFQLILDFETVRARRFGIDHYAAISVNPKEAENLQLAHEVIDSMGEYLDHPRCIAIGEIGYNLITPAEDEIFRRQLRLAKERNMLVIIHTPHDTPHVSKLDGVRRILDVLADTEFPYEHAIIDHNTEETMATSRSIPVWTGMTVYPYSKLNPVRAAQLVEEYGVERMLINSSADWGVSDPCSLSDVASELESRGFPEQDIRKLVWDNPLAFYSHVSTIHPNPNLQPEAIETFQR